MTPVSPRGATPNRWEIGQLWTAPDVAAIERLDVAALSSRSIPSAAGRGRVPSVDRHSNEGGTTVDASQGSQGSTDRRRRLRSRLDEERARSEARATTLERQLEDIIASTDTANVDDEHDPEGSTIAFERAQVIELLKVTRAELRELDEAAARLDEPSFGVCERCERPIPAERLLARPASRRCVTCAADR